MSQTAVSSSEGEPVPAVSTVYDPTSGRVVETVAGGDRVVRRFDRLGRMTGYTDASGNEATTVYDAYGRVAQTSDGKGSQSFSYDPATWQVVEVVDSQAGRWSTVPGGYDADGVLRS